MAERTVTIRLKMDVSDTVGPAGQAEVAITGLDAKVTGLGRKSEETTRKTQETGRTFMKLAGESGFLSAALRETEARLHALNREFDRTGDASLIGRIRSTRGELRELENVARDEAGPMAGRALGKGFIGSFADIISKPSMWAVVGVGVAAVAPLLLGMIGGAVLTATGLGGIALGVVGQLDDPRIREAAKNLGKQLKDSLTGATEGLAKPIAAALDTLTSGAGPFIASLKDAFTGLGPGLGTLAQGFVGLLEHLGPGLNKALSEAGPILQALGRALPDLGDSLSGMFKDIASGSKGATEALVLLVHMVGIFARTVGMAIRAGSNAFELFNRGVYNANSSIASMFEMFGGGGKLIGGFFRHFADGARSLDAAARGFHVSARNLHDVGGAADYSAEKLDFLAGKVNQVANTFDNISGAMTLRVLNSLMSIDQANLGLARSLLDVRDSFRENGHELRLTTEAGVANRSAVLEAVQANIAMYQAQIAVGMSADDASAAYKANTDALEAQLHKVGLTQAEIDGLIGKYRSVPGDVKTDIAVNGLTEAINNLGNLIASVNGLNGRNFGFTVTETTIRRQINEEGNFGHVQRWGGIFEHAAIGKLREASLYSSMNPGRFMIAEPGTGGEAFVPKFGDHNRSTAILDRAARWYGGRFAPGGSGGGHMDNRTIHYNIYDSTDPSRVVAAIKRYEQSNGKNWRN